MALYANGDKELRLISHGEAFVRNERSVEILAIEFPARPTCHGDGCS